MSKNLNSDNNFDEKISIITPTYNSEKYIKKTIESVRNQTYYNWEMLIIDDCSVDSTVELVKSMKENDQRIHLIELGENVGAARARNVGLENSSGRYIAYLDSDDIWMPTKLEQQVLFMKKNNVAFSCVTYEIIDSEGKRLNKVIHMLPKLNYSMFLKNNLLQTVGIMIDTNKVNKRYLVMPDIFRPEDAATWLQILKSGIDCYGIDETLAQYRRVENSLSGNKFKGALGMWKLYRNIEKLSFPFSCYCFIRYAFLAIWKRFYFNHN